MNIVLANAAFGDDPRRWPLPPASTPHELWLRAVAAGGQGRYGSAMADLAGVACCSAAVRWCRWRTAPGRRSCVSSAGTTGPAGGTAGRWPWPVRTRRPVPTPSSGWPPTRSAWGGSRRRRRRYGAPVSCSPDRCRRGCRCGWRGCRRNWRWRAATARRPWATPNGPSNWRPRWARRGMPSNRTWCLPRRCAARATSTGRGMVADAALDAAGGLGIIPLRWALACLLADIGSARHSAADVLRIRNECAATVRRRGGDLAER